MCQPAGCIIFRYEKQLVLCVFIFLLTFYLLTCYSYSLSNANFLEPVGVYIFHACVNENYNHKQLVIIVDRHVINRLAL